MAANPYDKAHELARAIRDSEVYLNYLEAKRSVERSSDYKGKIYSIREKQMEVNRAQFMGDEPSPEMVQELALEFAKLNQHEEIAVFFETEARFLKMFNEIQEIIQKALQQDLVE